MSAKAIREYDAKAIIAYWLCHASPLITYDINPSTTITPVAPRLAQILCDPPHAYSSDAYAAHVRQALDTAAATYPWLLDANQRLVVKPDQLIKRRAQRGLLSLDCSWDEVCAWVQAHAGEYVTVGRSKGALHVFLCEPFIPHESQHEYYLCIRTAREGDWLLFTHEGGVDVGDVEAKTQKLMIPIDLSAFPTKETLETQLFAAVPVEVRDALVQFTIRLYTVFVTCHFTYLEINPLVVQLATDATVTINYLDVASRLDQTAEFEASAKWALARSPHVLQMREIEPKMIKVNMDQGPPMVFPPPFGREMTKEECYVSELDAKTGASLKLTLLNPKGRIWTLIAGGGASVIFADAIVVAGYADELANYGEYSGAPTETQTYEYTRTIFDLMTRGPLHPEGKYLFIGGGIANFTNVSTTFKGVIRAMKEYASAFHAHKVQIWVRRAGPNYQEGLRAIKAAGEELSLPLKVFGPETHISDIVHFALLGKKPTESTININ